MVCVMLTVSLAGCEGLNEFAADPAGKAEELLQNVDLEAILTAASRAAEEIFPDGKAGEDILPSGENDEEAEISDTLIRKNVIVEGSIFGGSSSDRIETEISFDPAWLASGDNTVYNPDLAAFSAVLCADTYFRSKDLDAGRQNRVLYAESDAEYDTAYFLSALGFENVQKIESFKLKEYAFDTNDSVTMILGYLPAEDCNIYAAAVRGCYSAGEWASAFDPGTTDASYEALTGEHPEWTEQKHYKSMDIAKNRALEFIEAFMEENGDPSLPDRLLLTGHSRGGAIANLLGAYCEKNSDAETFTYTFNSLPVTEADDAADYRTVFNLFDAGDLFVRMFPFTDGNVKRYGTDLPFSVAGSEDVLGEVAELKGRDDYACLSDEQFAEYDAMFAERFAGRDSLYLMREVKKVYGSETDAENDYTLFRSLISSESGLGLELYTDLHEVIQNGNGQYEFSFCYCDAALLLSYAMLLAYGTSAAEAVQTLFADDAGGARIASFLADYYALVSGGHSLVLDYVISGYVK